jgi:hypothetical protein
VKSFTALLAALVLPLVPVAKAEDLSTLRDRIEQLQGEIPDLRHCVNL